MKKQLRSCLYKLDLKHERLRPKRHSFRYGLFMFLLDLDELPELEQRFRLFSHGAFNLFSFYDADHFQIDKRSTKEKVESYLLEQGVDCGPYKILLLCSCRVFGYVFNPVSFFFVYRESANELESVCVVSEVGNTFLERKAYLVSKDPSRTGWYFSRQAKNFYVSPFSDLDLAFEFRLKEPAEDLEIYVNEFTGSEQIFFSSLKGESISLSDKSMLAIFCRFPLITLKIIFLIHFQAMLLWLKGLPFRLKEADPEKQTAVINPHISLGESAQKGKTDVVPGTQL